MNNRGSNGNGERTPPPKQRPRRGIPSFIDELGAKTLSSGPRVSMANAPIFEMPRSLRIWRKVRWPVFITVALVVLLTVAGITRSVVVAKKISDSIAEAGAAEVKGTLETMEAAERLLTRLVEKRPDSESAQAALAWQVLLKAILWRTDGWSEKAKAAVDAVRDEEGELAVAARAAWALLNGDAKVALTEATDGLAVHADSDRLKMMRVLSLVANGRAEEARELSTAILAGGTEYVPLIMATVGAEMDLGNRLGALEAAGKLLKVSPNNLYAMLVVIRLELPDWGEAPPALNQAMALQKRLLRLETDLETAPPRVAGLGFYLRGRLALLLGQSNEANEAFESALTHDRNSDVVGWFGASLKQSKGCREALAALKRYADISGKEVLDLEAQCLLDLNYVNRAKTVIDRLAGTGELSNRLTSLRWLHAIRSGNTSQAKARAPKQVGQEDLWGALEAYFMFKQAGDTDAMGQLTRAMSKTMPACAKAIRAWHAKNLSRAFKVLDIVPTEPHSICESALMAALMRAHTAPAAVKAAAEETVEASAGNPFFEIDRGLAMWRVDGYDTAIAVLDAIAEAKPDGVPLKAKLARAYMEMAQPEKAIEVIDRSEVPELFGLRFLAAEAAGKKNEVKKLMSRASAKYEKTPHPAVAYVMLRAKVEAGDLTGVGSWIDEHLSKDLVGGWTSEITEVAANAMNLQEQRVEAESFIQKTARKVITSAGADESLDTWKAQLRLNFKRIGKYRNRALTLSRVLVADHIKDPQLLYWLAQENIQGGSERLGLRLLRDIMDLDPAFKPGWETMVQMGWLNDSRTTDLKKFWPSIPIPEPEK